MRGGLKGYLRIRYIAFVGFQRDIPRVNKIL